MIKRIFTVLAYMFVLGTSVTIAQVKVPVSWDHEFTSDEAVAVGEEVILTFTASIEPDHWVYSSVPSEGNPGAATSFEIDDQAGVEVLGTMNEEGNPKKYFDDIFNTDMVKYYNKVVFKQPVKITAKDAKLEGYIRYQVCNDNLCIPGDYTFSYDPSVSDKKKR